MWLAHDRATNIGDNIIAVNAPARKRSMGLTAQPGGTDGGTKRLFVGRSNGRQAGALQHIRADQVMNKDIQRDKNVRGTQVSRL